MTPLSDGQEVRYLRTMFGRREAEDSGAFAWRSPRRLLVAAVVIASFACVAVAARAMLSGRSAPTFRTEGGEVQGNGYLRTGPATRTIVHFSDGTQVSFHENTRGRIVGVDNHGARIAIDEGTAQVQVAARAGGVWTFDAGPFSVSLKDGAFLLAWKSSETEMDLRLDQGAAAVSGPLLHDARALRAGERLTIRLDEGKVILRQQEASERSPLEADISILRAFLAEQDISAATDAPEDLRGARLRRDPAHAAESDDSVALPATAPRPGPSQKR